jgi:ATP-dependent Lon protease
MGIARNFVNIDFHNKAIGLWSNHISCDAGIALVAAIYSALKKHSAVPALLNLGNLSNQGNIKAVQSLAEPLQMDMGNGARRALIPIENKHLFL